jgi:hypothetical protein
MEITCTGGPRQVQGGPWSSEDDGYDIIWHRRLWLDDDGQTLDVLIDATGDVFLTPRCETLGEQGAVIYRDCEAGELAVALDKAATVASAFNDASDPRAALIEGSHELAKQVSDKWRVRVALDEDDHGSVLWDFADFSITTDAKGAQLICVALFAAQEEAYRRIHHLPVPVTALAISTL